MPITGYSETINEVLYTIESSNGIVEQLPAEQLLAIDPILIELYDYKNAVTMETRIEKRLEKTEVFPKRMQMMIIDYFEVGHYEVGMQLIENTFGTGKKPPFPLLLSLINFMLQPKQKFKNKQALKEHWLHCRRAHAILMDVLNLFGPEIYHPVWNQFRYFELISAKSAKKELDDDYDELDTGRLGEYRDFWNYTDRLLSKDNQDLDAKCRVLILDFFVNILQSDLKSRVDSESKVQDSIFVRTLKKDTLCRVSKYDYYLKILLRTFPNEDAQLLHLTGDILNMFITIACFGKISDMNELVSQVYTFFQEMTADNCQQFMQTIKYPTFVIALCDKALADTDVSRVEKEYRHFRNSSHVPLKLDKIFFYTFSTLPHSTDNLEAIYRHIVVVSKYCMSVLSTATVNHKRFTAITNSALPEDQLELLVTRQNDAQNWEMEMEQLIHNCGGDLDFDAIEKIRWAMKLTILTLSEYF